MTSMAKRLLTVHPTRTFYTIFPSSESGNVQCSGTYSETRLATGTFQIGASLADSTVAGQQYVPADPTADEPYDEFWIGRQGFLLFDLSLILETILSIKLFLSPVAVVDTIGDSIVQARSYDYGPTLTSIDYRTASEFSSLPLRAELPTSSHITNQYNQFIDLSMLDAIDGAGFIRLVLSTDKFISGIDPSPGNSYIAYDTVGTGPKKAKLVVTI